MNVLAIVVIFIISFSILWVFISILMSFLSGWMKLSRYYATISTNEISIFKNRTAIISMVNYRNIVTFGVDNSGLYLLMFPLFRIGHKKLYIPWTEIEIEEKDFIFIKYTIMKTRKARVKIKIGKNLAKEILEFKR